MRKKLKGLDPVSLMMLITAAVDGRKATGHTARGRLWILELDSQIFEIVEAEGQRRWMKVHASCLGGLQVVEVGLSQVLLMGEINFFYYYDGFFSFLFFLINFYNYLSQLVYFQWKKALFLFFIYMYILVRKWSIFNYLIFI